MAAILSIITTLLPIILKLIAMFAGGGAALSAQRLSAMPDVSYGDYGAYVGGWGGAALASWGAGELAAWLKRRSVNQSIDWSKVQAGVAAGRGINIVKAVSFLVRVFTLVRNDAEASKLFGEIFGTPSASLPTDENHLLSLALVRRD